MKKTIASAIAFCLLLLTVSPSFAQKSRGRKAPEAAPIAAPETFVRAASDGSGVWISWEASFDSDERAFYIYRLDHTSAKPINSNPIPRVTGGQGYFDREGTLGSTYVLEAIGSNGNRNRVAQVPVHYVPDLSVETGGRSSDQLAEISVTPGTYSSYLYNIPPDVAVGMSQGIKPTNIIVQRQVAARGGVKFAIKKDGFYRVTRAQLAAAGFDMNSDHNNWRLFQDGIEQAILVELAGNFLEFYAKSKEVIETDTRYLYLTSGTTAGRRMPTRVPADNGGQTVASGYDQYFRLKQRTNYIAEIMNGEADNWWGDLFSTEGMNIIFDLSGIDTSATTALVTLKLHGFSNAGTNVNATLNGNNLGSLPSTGPHPFGGQVTVPISALVEGTNTLTLTGTTFAYSMFDSIEIAFKREFHSDQNRASFYTIAAQRSVIGNFSSANVRMFDVTDDHQPTQVTNLNIVNTGAGYTINYPAHRARLYHAVEDSGIQQVVSVIPNLPSTLSTRTHNGLMTIITHRDFATQAAAWADYRRAQGISVEVVDIEDIYDEFNFGMATVGAITAFLKYAHQRWRTPPQYVLLLGDASFDPKNYLGFGNQNFIPSKLVNTVYLETGSDEVMADFNADDLAEIAIGRIPARTPAQVTQALNKTMTFETPAMQNMNRGVVCSYDEPNGWNFAGTCSLLMSELPSSVPTFQVNRLSPNSGQALVNHINSGKYLVNYSGHGTTGNWHSSSFLGINNFSGNPNFPQVTNGNSLSIFTMLTCFNSYFVNAYFDSVAEVMQKHNNGGSAANWSSTGKSTPDVQQDMAVRFFNRLAGGTIPRLGDLVRDAKSVLPLNAHTRDVKVTWALIGDPMLKIR